MTLAEQIGEILNEIDLGPWHWADLDLILVYLEDTYGYDPKDIPEIKMELNKQAHHHKIRLRRKKTIHVWATRPDIVSTDILQEYLELE